MTDYTVTITDAAQVAGITAAREAYNAALPDYVDEETGEATTHPDTLDTDAAYVQHVVSAAAANYAARYGVTEADKEAFVTKLEESDQDAAASVRTALKMKARG